jgi:hypothetical protein
VISTDVGGARDYVPEHCGQLARRGDADGHARLAIDWLQNNEKRANAGLLARKHALDSLVWRHAAEALNHS